MKKIFTGSTLKIFAVCSMLVDHVGQIVLKNGIALKVPYSMLSDEQFLALLSVIDMFHMVGRLAFPIFCFLLVEGFMHTQHLKKYFLNLFLFAVVSEPIYDLANSGQLFSMSQQNVMFTLLLGLTVLTIIKKSNGNPLIAIITIFAGSFIAYIGMMDGFYYGIGLISIFYLCYKKSILKYALAATFMFACGLDFSLRGLLDGYFIVGLLSLVLISMYNGKRGIRMKYFFYLFYPVHLLLLSFISIGIGKFLI